MDFQSIVFELTPALAKEGYGMYIHVGQNRIATSIKQKFITTLITPLLFIVVTLFTGCREKNTNDPIEAYNLWAGNLPSKDVQVLHGKYWKSSHWSKEYIMYLEIKASQLWRQEFIRQNNLVETNKNQGERPDMPSWFKPGKKFKILVPKEFSQGSVYYEDSLSGIMFIYEIQL